MGTLRIEPGTAELLARHHLAAEDAIAELAGSAPLGLDGGAATATLSTALDRLLSASGQLGLVSEVAAAGVAEVEQAIRAVDEMVCRRLCDHSDPLAEALE